MYVWLSLPEFNGRISLSESICDINPMAAPETNADELRTRRTLVMQILTRSHPELKGAESSRVYMALAQLVESLPPRFEDLDFTIHLGMAHFCLPEAKRTAREQGITALIETYFGPPGRWREDIVQRLETLRTQMILIPDALIESWVSGHCGLLAIRTTMTPGDPQCDRQALSDYASMNDVVAHLAVGDSDKTSISQSLSMIYCLFTPIQRKGLVELVADPAYRKGLPIFVRAANVVSQKAPVTPLHKAQALFSILVDMAGTGLDPGDPQADEIIEMHVLHLKLQRTRMYGLARNETVEALNANVPLGARGVATRTVLLKLRLDEHQLNRRLGSERMGKTRTPPAAVGQQAGTNDMEPVHAWSVARLVRWIQGPLAARSTTGRLNRQAVVRQERGAIEKDLREQREVGLKGADVPAAITEDEVGVVMNDALAATARFFLDDIVDMAPLARSLGTQAGLIDRCVALQPQLQALANAPASFDEEKARALLQDAETCVVELRKGIRVAEASAQLVKRFNVQLGVALGAEALVLGKRHGGVIACPLRATDWAWVAKMYHRRWLPQVNRLVIDGEEITLRPDQAVALYVTGSSQSNHAFDVSVHLWQRRAGCIGAPSDLLDDCPPMNETQWFDTYVPCAVLHVPQAQ